MGHYNLVDIHFHTNLSFDAYENNRGSDFDWEDLISKELETEEQLKIKMIAKTDHNIFGFNQYSSDKKLLKENGIKYLPGIEINGESNVHWIFIFNDDDLNTINDGKITGDALDVYIKDFFGYKKIMPEIKVKKQAQVIERNVGDFVEILNNLNISFIAIPHLDKTGGWYPELKKNDGEYLTMLRYLNDNIISGFESKHQNEFIKRHIKQTEYHIQRLIDSYTGNQDEEGLQRRLDHKDLLVKMGNDFNNNNISIIRGSDFHGDFGDKKEGLKSYHKIKDQLFYMKSECTFEGLRFALLDQQSRTFDTQRLKRFEKDKNVWIKEIDYINQRKEIKTLKFKDGINSIIGARGTGKSYLISSLIGDTDIYSKSSITEDIRITDIRYASNRSVKKLEVNDYDIVSQKGRKGKDIAEESSQIHEILAIAPYDTNVFVKKIKDYSSKQQIIKDKKEIRDYFKVLNNMINSKKKLFDYLKETSIDYSFLEEYNQYVDKVGQSAWWKEQFDNLHSFLSTKSNIKEKQKIGISKINDKLTILEKEIDATRGYLEVKKTNPNRTVITEYLEKSIALRNFYEEVLLLTKTNAKDIISVNERVKSLSRNLSEGLTNEEKSYDERLSSFRSFIKKTISLTRNFDLYNTELKTLKSDKLVDEYTFNFDVNYDVYSVKTLSEIDFDHIDSLNYQKIFNNYNGSPGEEELSIIRNGKLDLEYMKKLIESRDRRRNSINLEIPITKESVHIKVNDEQFRNILQMSQGERSDLLLQMILNENTDKVLVLDQPEDDLDNETVFLTLINKLRTLKLRRQIFIVTHNANIAINGDSDTITICENDGNEFTLNTDTMESTKLYDYSSLNSCLKGRQIDIAVNILEGGKSALRRRVKTIGYKDLFFEEKENG